MLRLAAPQTNHISEVARPAFAASPAQPLQRLSASRESSLVLSDYMHLATRAHELPQSLFAASAKKIASGQVWLLPASALIVDRPVLIGLVAFGVLALATLRFCGARTLASGSSWPRGIDAARLRHHRVDTACSPGDVHERHHARRLRRFGDSSSLGRRDHRNRVEPGWHRSSRSGPRRNRHLRNCWRRVVASPGPLHPHRRAPVCVPNRLRHRVTGTAGRCCRSGSTPSVRSSARTKRSTPRSPTG